MLEKDIENLIASHPDDIFPGEHFKLIGQQYVVEGKRIDILFEDKLKRKVIVEVKRGILSREASGQITEYYGLLKDRNQHEFYEMVLCANVIPMERRRFLEETGIECKELGIAFVSELAKKYGYTFLDDQSSYQRATPGNAGGATFLTTHSEDVSVWIFQTNPQKYDILNALSDSEIGNSIYWRVNQNRKKIKSGHLGLIWMSGDEAGIYAVARIESDPALMKDNPVEEKYWFEPEEAKEGRIRVEMTIVRRLVNRPVLRKTLSEISELADLSILRQPQGTNFPVRNNEWRIISQLLP